MRPGGGAGGEELRLGAALLPLRLRLDQAVVDFLQARAWAALLAHRVRVPGGCARQAIPQSLRRSMRCAGTVWDWLRGAGLTWGDTGRWLPRRSRASALSVKTLHID